MSLAPNPIRCSAQLSSRAAIDATSDVRAACTPRSGVSTAMCEAWFGMQVGALTSSMVGADLPKNSSEASSSGYTMEVKPSCVVLQ